MNMLSELTSLFDALDIPVETGVFSETAPEQYVVFTPLADTFELFADNLPYVDIQEIRISLFSKGNYLKTKNAIVRSLLSAEITITDRRYIGHEDNTGYHHFAIDVAKEYETEE